MIKLQEKIVDVITGETIFRDYSDEEMSIAQFEQAKIEAKIQIEAEILATREALKASAKAKLVAGQPLTAEEADTLVL